MRVVRWCYFRVVRRCHACVVRRCHACAVRRCHACVVRRCNAGVVRRCNAGVVRRCHTPRQFHTKYTQVRDRDGQLCMFYFTSSGRARVTSVVHAIPAPHNNRLTQVSAPVKSSYVRNDKWEFCTRQLHPTGANVTEAAIV